MKFKKKKIDEKKVFGIKGLYFFVCEFILFLYFDFVYYFYIL